MTDKYQKALDTIYSCDPNWLLRNHDVVVKALTQASRSQWCTDIIKAPLNKDVLGTDKDGWMKVTSRDSYDDFHDPDRHYYSESPKWVVTAWMYLPQGIKE